MAKNKIRPSRIDNYLVRELKTNEIISPEYLGDGSLIGNKFLRSDGTWAKIITMEQEIQLTGQYEGRDAKIFHIIGRRAAFTSTSLFNDVGEGLGSSSQANFPVLSGSETIQVVSSSANDTVGGTGARTIKMVYINTNYELVETPDVNLNGLSPVQILANGVLQVLWFEVTQTGNNNAAVGILTIRTSAPIVLSIIPANSNKSMDAVFMVPDGYTAYIPQWSGSNIVNGQDFRLLATVNTFDRSLSSVYHFQDSHNTPSNNDFDTTIPYLKFPSRCKIKISTISTSAVASTRADVDFTIIIIANE